MAVGFSAVETVGRSRGGLDFALATSDKNDLLGGDGGVGGQRAAEGGGNGGIWIDDVAWDLPGLQ